MIDTWWRRYPAAVLAFATGNNDCAGARQTRVIFRTIAAPNRPAFRPMRRRPLTRFICRLLLHKIEEFRTDWTESGARPRRGGRRGVCGTLSSGGDRFREVLEILGETPVAPEPAAGALDHAAARQDNEPVPVVARLTISICSSGTVATRASTCQAL